MLNQFDKKMFVLAKILVDVIVGCGRVARWGWSSDDGRC